MFPLKDLKLSLKVWDKDLLSEDDFISESSVDIEKEMKLAYDNNTEINFY